MKPGEFFEIMLGLTISVMFGMFIGGVVNFAMIAILGHPNIILRLVITVVALFLFCMLLSGDEIVGGPSSYPETWKALWLEASVKSVFFFIGAIPTIFFLSPTMMKL